jgi:hypothetical protein
MNWKAFRWNRQCTDKEQRKTANAPPEIGSCTFRLPVPVVTAMPTRSVPHLCSSLPKGYTYIFLVSTSPRGRKGSGGIARGIWNSAVA